jgi:hypothetical protein
MSLDIFLEGEEYEVECECETCIEFPNTTIRIHK